MLTPEQIEEIRKRREDRRLCGSTSAGTPARFQDSGPYCGEHGFVSGTIEDDIDALLQEIERLREIASRDCALCADAMGGCEEHRYK